MADFTFTIPSRYDETIASEGVWFEVVDESEQEWGKFKLAMFDNDNPAIKKAQERMKLRYAKEIRLKQVTMDKLALEVMLEAVLLDWEGIKGGNGKAIPFSKEAARAYFDLPQVSKFVFPALLEFSADVRNFAAVNKDEVLGN